MESEAFRSCFASRCSFVCVCVDLCYQEDTGFLQ